jgi:heme exporter protein D
MAEYFAMGGYAAYIWPAYGITVVVLIGLLVGTVRGLRSRETMVRALEAARPSRAARRAARAWTDAPALGEPPSTIAARGEARGEE